MIVKGVETLTFTGKVRRFNKQTGAQVGYEYEGLVDAVDAAFAVNTSGAGACDDADVVQDGVTARLTLWYGGNDAGSQASINEEYDTWELVPNIIEKPIWTHRKTLGMTTEIIAYVRNAVKEAIDNNQTFTGTVENTQELFDHAVSGYDGYQLPQYVLRRTTTVGSAYSKEIDFADSFKLFTTAQVKSAESIPTGIQFDLDAIDANLPTLGVGGSLASSFQYLWMKFPPHKTQSARNKFDLVYEYWHAAWSTWIYDVKS